MMNGPKNIAKGDAFFKYRLNPILFVRYAPKLPLKFSLQRFFELMYHIVTDEMKELNKRIF